MLNFKLKYASFLQISIVFNISISFQVSKGNSENIAKLRKHSKFNGAFQSKDYVDDFKREMLFHRQAQSAVLDGVPKLKSLGILTKRPDDYFAEMAKSDQHMHKVFQFNLLHTINFNTAIQVKFFFVRVLYQIIN